MRICNQSRVGTKTLATKKKRVGVGKGRQLSTLKLKCKKSQCINSIATLTLHLGAMECWTLPFLSLEDEMVMEYNAPSYYLYVPIHINEKKSLSYPYIVFISK